jgi:hypothetical protein
MALPKIVQVLERHRRENEALKKCLFVHMALRYDPTAEFADQQGFARGLRLLGMSEQTFLAMQEAYMDQEIAKYTL